MRTGRIYPDAIVRPLTRPWLFLCDRGRRGRTSGRGVRSAVGAECSHRGGGQQHDLPRLDGRESSGARHHDDHGLEHDAGTLTFRVNIPNRPTLDQGTIVDDLGRLRQQDHDGRSPDLAGVDYVMQLVQGEINLYRWDGSDFTRRFGDPSAVTLTFSYQGGVTVRISAAELGNTKKFKFFVDVITGCTVDPVTQALDCTAGLDDIAPGGAAGLYPYDVKLTPPTLVVKSLKPIACEADGGSCRSRSGSSRRGRIPEPSCRTAGLMCIGRLGKARLKAQVQRVLGGAAVCTWNLPAKREGQDVPRIGHGRVRRLKASAELRREGPLASAASATPSASRLSPRSSSPATGTAAGSIDRTPRSVVEQALTEGARRARL